MDRYWNPYVAGVVLGIVLFAAYFVTGSGLGASGGVARLVARAEKAAVPEHVNRSPQLAPLAGGANDPLDHRLVWMILGTVIGGFASGLLAGRTKVETYRGPRIGVKTRWLLAFVGGALMGYGAGLGRGCTSGQALSGGAVLAVGSWAFMMMVFAGAYLLAYPLRKVWN
jgi:uncharacterized membrane protein YedE/YeeE